MIEGPFKEAFESDTSGVVRRELITYRVVNDVIVKEQATRVYFRDGDYQDSVTVIPLEK